MTETLINNLKSIAEPIVQQHNMFLVDIEVKHANTVEVWVLVDSEATGVNLDECSKVSRSLGLELEEKDMFDGKYRLNVSSPGLSRPLSDIRQYKKNVGRTAKVKYKVDDSYHTVEGVLEKVDGQNLLLKSDDGEQTEINFSDVVETKIVPKI